MMDNARQHTIADAYEISGIALHSGRAIKTYLTPLPENSGIVFYRSDKQRYIKAAAENVLDTRLATTLGCDQCQAGTVEHLLSALSALGIDNIQIEINGEELPILDGSAAPWMLLLTDACGVKEQPALRQVIRVKQKVEVSLNGATACFTPAAGDESTYTIDIDFPYKVVQRTAGHFFYLLSARDYEEEISRARTFCYVNEVEYMRRRHRALGGSLRCAVVFDDLGVLNEEGLRYPDEFARHKILDAIGDCYINGNRIIGNYQAYCPGHTINHALVMALMAQKDAWEWSVIRAKL